MHNENKLLLIAASPGPRLRYVFSILFDQWYPLPWQLCSPAETPAQWQGPVLAYTDHPPDQLPALHIKPEGLLSERDIRRHDLDVIGQDGQPRFFRTGTEESRCPFDLPAMIFWMLSRYEEYLPHEPDRFGRFPAAECLSVQHGFHRMALADRLGNELVAKLGDLFPAWSPPPRSFDLQPTFDIDLAWAFLQRPKWLMAASFLRNMWTSPELAHAQLRVWRGKDPDPYQTFDLLLEHSLTNAPVLFFLLSSRGPYDKGISPQRPAYRRLISDLHQRGITTGIHPSMQSNHRLDRLLREVTQLESITGAEVLHSRQHYVMLRFPETYRLLIRAGIQHDWSMGFVDEIGFRAGTSRTFTWYDLPKEEATGLVIHPFHVMDVSLRQYLGLTPAEAIDQIEGLVREVRECGGTFTYLWHNSSFAEATGWKPWIEVYERMNALSVS